MTKRRLVSKNNHVQVRKDAPAKRPRSTTKKQELSSQVRQLQQG